MIKLICECKKQHRCDVDETALWGRKEMPKLYYAILEIEFGFDSRIYQV